MQPDTKIEIEGINLVLLGAFNPAIFHPTWFVQQNISSDSEIDLQKVKSVSVEVTEVQIGSIALSCVPDRFTLDITNMGYAEKLLDLACNVLSLLPHIPVRACGINHRVHYRLPSVEYWHTVGHTLAPKTGIWDDLYDKAGMQQLGITGFKKETAIKINTVIQPSSRIQPGIYINANTHCQMDSDDEVVGGALRIRDFIKTNWGSAIVAGRDAGNKIFERIPPK